MKAAGRSPRAVGITRFTVSAVFRPDVRLSRRSSRHLPMYIDYSVVRTDPASEITVDRRSKLPLHSNLAGDDLRVALHHGTRSVSHPRGGVSRGAEGRRDHDL